MRLRSIMAMTRTVDMATTVGSVHLKSPVMTASGTSGYGSELAAYMDLDRLGAVVVKSMAAFEWPGNPAPRVCAGPASMINSVGLQGHGVERWLDRELPPLVERGATVIASIWGRTPQEFERAARMLAPAYGIAAIEVNVSCPNVEDRNRMFAHSPVATASAVQASAAGNLPMWVKLSANVADLLDIARSAIDAGAEGVVLINTLIGMAIDIDRRRYSLGSGAGGGGVSGPAIRPVAVRAVHDVRSAYPGIGIVGVGGISRGRHAVEMMMAGADAVEVGTATMLDPRAPMRVQRELKRWCKVHGVDRARDLVDSVDDRSAPADVEERDDQ
ncbi:MAG: dihydroorotate dehydrogenase [Acidimicrobiales bacterium]